MPWTAAGQLVLGKRARLSRMRASQPWSQLCLYSSMVDSALRMLMLAILQVVVSLRAPDQNEPLSRPGPFDGSPCHLHLESRSHEPLTY